MSIAKNIQLLVEKAKKQKNKDLVLVDIDEKINNSEDYLKKLNKYCYKHSRVIQIWNKELKNKPQYDFPNQIKELELPKVTKIDLTDVDKLFYGAEKEAILSNFEDGIIIGKITGKLYFDMYNNGWLYLGHDDIKGDIWAIINSETNLFLKQLKKIRRNLILFGKQESLSVITPVLKANGINFEYDTEFQNSLNSSK